MSRRFGGHRLDVKSQPFQNWRDRGFRRSKARAANRAPTGLLRNANSLLADRKGWEGFDPDEWRVKAQIFLPRSKLQELYEVIGGALDDVPGSSGW